MPFKLKNDLTGQKFGLLTVIKYIKGGKWECLCECGKIVQVKTNALTTGDTKSCGCLNWEQIHKKQRNSKDFTGKWFGDLEVLKYADSDKNGTRWLCKCHVCGQEKIITAAWLKKYRSCGCLAEKARQEGTKSYHEQMRATKTNNLIFKEKSNKNSKTGIRGVCFLAKNQIYVAAISYQNKHYILKRSKDIEICIAARKEAEEKIRELARKEIQAYKNPTQSFAEWCKSLSSSDK